MIALNIPRVLAEKIQQYGFPGGMQKTAEIFAVHLLLLQGWVTRTTAMDLPSWTLTTEVFFYLCFPLLGIWLWKLQGHRLWLTAAGFYAGGQALSWIASPHFSIKTFNLLPPLHLSTFALGILLARWQTLRQAREAHARPRLWHVNLVLLLSIAGICGSVVAFVHIRDIAPYLHGALSPFFMGIIWSLSARPTLLSKLLSTNWLVALGNASYAIYLIHYPLLQLFRYFHWCALGMFPVFLAVCIGLSLLSFFYFETPVRHWLVGWFESRMPQVSAVPRSVAP